MIYAKHISSDVCKICLLFQNLISQCVRIFKKKKLKIRTSLCWQVFSSELDGRTRFLTVFRFTWYNGNCEYTAGSLRKIIITLRAVCAVCLTSNDDVLRVSVYDYNYYEITSTFSYSWCNYVSSPPPILVCEHLNNRYFTVSFSSKTDDLKYCNFFFFF